MELFLEVRFSYRGVPNGLFLSVGHQETYSLWLLAYP
jgi:hypothetical protein